MQTIGPAASVLGPSADVAMARHRGLNECDRLFAPAHGRCATSLGMRAIQASQDRVFLGSSYCTSARLDRGRQNPWSVGSAARERLACVERSP